MKRREALKLSASLIGTAIIGSELFLSGCINKEINISLFSDNDINLLDEVGEVILPGTDLSPGAKDAKIGLFIKSIVTHCYDETEQNIFTNGIKELNQLSRKKYGVKFVKLKKKQKYDLIALLDKDTRNRTDDNPPHFFPMMKQLTIWGYFTSEPGATKALRYNQIPGKFIGCIPYKNGDKAWS